MADKKTASTIERLEDGSIKLDISIPWADVEKTREGVLESVLKTTTIPGFRKGQAPKKMVEETVDADRVREEVLKKLLPEAYVTAVQEHNIRPIVNPKIHVEKLEEGTDWTFNATTCELPTTDLGDYKKRIGAITSKSKIAIPGEEAKEPDFNEVMKALMEGTKVTIPSVLIEQEVDRLLSQTLQEIKSLGLTLEQYLSSTGKKPEDLRADYAVKAENDMKIEFALQQVAEEEKIMVEEPEVEAAVEKAQNPEERANLEANRYMLANILRQQKTLDFLKSL